MQFEKIFGDEDMKLLNVISVLGSVAVLAACGANNQNGTYNPYALNNGLNYNYNPGMVQTNFPGMGMTGTQTPLYQNGQIVGYKTRTPIMGGVYPNVTDRNFQQQAQVNAGDRLVINLSRASYRVATAYCDGGLADKVTTGNKSFQLPNISLLLNGQPLNVSNGSSVTVPAAGTLTLQAQLNSVNVSCGWLFKNRPAQIMAYSVDLGGGGMAGMYGASAAVEVERCTNYQGSVIACPY